MVKPNNKDSRLKIKKLNNEGVYILLSESKYQNMCPAAKDKMIELMEKFKKESDGNNILSVKKITPLNSKVLFLIYVKL